MNMNDCTEDRVWASYERHGDYVRFISNPSTEGAGHRSVQIPRRMLGKWLAFNHGYLTAAGTRHFTEESELYFDTREEAEQALALSLLRGSPS